MRGIKIEQRAVSDTLPIENSTRIYRGKTHGHALFLPDIAPEQMLGRSVIIAPCYEKNNSGKD